MYDQAQKLRRMMLDQQASDAPLPPPRMIAFVGGYDRVGNSTACVAIASAMVRTGERVLLIDGNLQRGSITTMTGVQDPDCCVQDVLAGKVRLGNAFQPGPHGLLVLTSRGESLIQSQYTHAETRRLFEDTANASQLGDLIFLDCSYGDQRLLSPAIQNADRVVVTTTVHEKAVLETYRTIKSLVNRHPALRCDAEGNAGTATIDLLINGADNEQLAAGIAERMQATCQHYLDAEVGYAGWIPSQPDILDVRPDSVAYGLIAAIGARLSSVERSKPGNRKKGDSVEVAKSS